MIMRRLRQDVDGVVVAVWYIVIAIVILCAIMDICGITTN